MENLYKLVSEQMKRLGKASPLALARTSLLISSVIVLLTAPGIYSVRASSTYGIPIRAAVLVDEGYSSMSSYSDSFQNIRGILNVNKIPFDTWDISQIGNRTLLDSSSSPRYSVLLILIPGWRISSENSKLIIDATEKGMGAVGLLPDSANADLMPIFGIDELGTEWVTSPSIQITKDKFTFSYEGETIYEDSKKGFGHLGHHLLRDVEVVAKFAGSGEPAVWTHKYSAGKTVFHNHFGMLNYKYQGILLQSILYAMPIGVACPINAGVIEVDDCPRSFYSPKQQAEDCAFYPNFKKWLQTYNFTASFFVAFSYSGNIDDFWMHPESLECASDIIKSGYELGLHCGTKHVPLKVAYWGSKAAIDSEVDTMMNALDLLRQRLSEEYGTQLGEVVSYVAPALEMGDYGYEALDMRTNIRYVGTSYFSWEQVTNRDFGWERDLDIYNLPRIQGSFYGLSQPQDEGYSLSWNILRSVIESGNSFLIFTHPDELELLDKRRFPDATMAKVFEAFRIWGDYVSEHYPFYRWWTSSELGQYLEKREGTVNAEWLPQSSTLKLKLSQPDDTVHIKTNGYLKSISGVNDTIILTFSDLPCDFDSGKYDVVNIAHDYFIYAKDSKSSRPVVPKTPFVFESPTIPTTGLQNAPG
jgi:hypothetical protein